MKQTALYQSHVDLGAKIVEFAGYAMPVQYDGIIAEHNWTRENAGLFDVSHMGQGLIEGASATQFFESITPSNFSNLAEGTAKYTVLLNDRLGIVDDLIVTKLSPTKFFLVYNAGCREKDENFIKSKLNSDLTFTTYNRALLALQGPKAEEVLSAIFDNIPQKYMTIAFQEGIFISRLGYTGEDGFEISVPEDLAEQVVNRILDNPLVKPIGLGARDSLRLEMGYPLYGHDIDDNTTPIGANLGWIMPKEKRASFPAPKHVRVGIEVLDKAIAREGTKILSDSGEEIGQVTSGGFSPTLQKPIAQGYVATEFSAIGTNINLELRGRKIPAKVHKINFIEPKTKSAK